MHIAPDLKQGTSGVPRILYCKMAAPLEVILSSDSGSQLWNLTVFDLHSGSSLLSYRGGNSSARTLTLLRGQYILSAQLGKNFINVWEIQRKVRSRYTAGWSKRSDRAGRMDLQALSCPLQFEPPHQKCRPVTTDSFLSVVTD